MPVVGITAAALPTLNLLSVLSYPTKFDVVALEYVFGTKLFEVTLLIDISLFVSLDNKLESDINKLLPLLDVTL